MRDENPYASRMIVRTKDDEPHVQTKLQVYTYVHITSVIGLYLYAYDQDVGFGNESATLVLALVGMIVALSTLPACIVTTTVLLWSMISFRWQVWVFVDAFVTFAHIYLALSVSD